MRKFPKIDEIPKLKEFQNCFLPALLDIAKTTINSLREQGCSLSYDEVLEIIRSEYEKFENLSTKTIINATGVIIHTNLGRGPISPELMARAAKSATHYTNLEYDLNSGKRGDRYELTSYLLRLLFGCGDALVVNNNAAAVFLSLNSLAGGAEVVVSRGELVEIGGGFRIPEVMSASGARLREVGTTNKTHLKDYENAIAEQTKMILKVHKSNYDIVGFSSDVGINELVKIARDRGLVSYYDLGSGYAGALPYSLGKSEPSVAKILESGVDLLSFSGDKLFGSVQCGIILGKKRLIKELKSNQMMRMLRVDKLTLALLNETISAYLQKNYSLIKPLNQMFKSAGELENMAKNILEKTGLRAKIIETKTFVGGGTLPNAAYPTIALALKGSARELESRYRQNGVIGRIEAGRFLLDMRSIFEDDFELLINLIKKIENE